MHEGFADNALKLCLFTDHQIFDRFHKYSLRSDRARSGRLALSLKELSSIETGDYIVHVDHGVGKFGGLLRTRVNGTTQEMIKLIYKNNDCIFVSIHNLHKLAKYRGKEGVEPTINKLGSGAWNRMKERTKSKLKDIARDLIRLYAARKEEKGFQFSPDSYLQHELEASFIYEDTPDQTTATAAVKKDMESPTKWFPINLIFPSLLAYADILSRTIQTVMCQLPADTSAFSETAKETMEDKIKRMLREEVRKM